MLLIEKHLVFVDTCSYTIIKEYTTLYIDTINPTKGKMYIINPLNVSVLLQMISIGV